MNPREQARRRSVRTLRWYPGEWRRRYGTEFVELLVSEMEERPHSLRRSLDVALSGVQARFAVAGLGGQPLDPDDSDRRRLIAAGGALTIFSVFALAIWSQLTIGWQWSKPSTPATSLAMIVMSIAVVALSVVSVAAAAPLIWNIGRRFARSREREVLQPLLVAIVSIGILLVGSRHFANGWPGTGGHMWSNRGIVPGGVAAFAWASTLSVSSYWVHPAALMKFPTGEVIWMLVSPLAFVSALVGSAKVVRRIEISPRVLRYETRAAMAATIAMALFLAGAAMWVFDGGPGPRDLFHIGAIDIVEVVVMGVALTMACRSVQTIHHGTPRLSAR